MVEPKLVKITSGKFIMGSTREQLDDLLKRFPEVEKKLLEREIPQHKIHLEEYSIGKYPVTNKEFSIFVEEAGYITTAEKEGTGFVFTPKFTVVKGADWRHPHGSD